VRHKATPPLKNVDETVRVWLASNSVRRSELLDKRWTGQVEVISQGIDGVEPHPSSYHNLVDAVRETCSWKIRTALSQITPSSTVVLTSDTLVESPSGGHLLGQPDSLESARMMLLKLIGTPHRIATCTAWAMTDNPEAPIHEHIEVAVARLSEPSDLWLDDYLTMGGWRGKAGGYDAGGEFSPWVTLIEGSMLSVLGFAVRGLETLEEALGIEPNISEWSLNE